MNWHQLLLLLIFTQLINILSTCFTFSYLFNDLLKNIILVDSFGTSHHTPQLLPSQPLYIYPHPAARLVPNYLETKQNTSKQNPPCCSVFPTALHSSQRHQELRCVTQFTLSSNQLHLKKCSLQQLMGLVQGLWHAITTGFSSKLLLDILLPHSWGSCSYHSTWPVSSCAPAAHRWSRC